MLLAFTFGIVSDRYDTRRGLVRDDAVAFALPFGGLIKVSQQPLIDLRDAMSRAAGDADVSLHVGQIPTAQTGN